MADTVKRLNYFDHQFLRAPDFNDEQDYHLMMRRYHNQLLHTPGIVQGLVPTAQAGATVVTISAGFAIDSQGREMVLPADKQLDLTSEATGKTVYFTIEYAEQQSDPSTDAGATGNTRWTELPNVTFSEQAPGANSTALVLGQVSRTASGLSAIDLSARTSAGVVVSGDLKVNSVSFKRDGVDPAAWPKLTSTGANQAQLSVSNLSIDASREILFADNGQIRCLDDNHKIRFNRSNNRLEVSEFGDIVFNTGGAAPPERLRIASSGNVGIGAQGPSAKLSIVANNAAEIAGTARSAVLLTSAGALPAPAGSELALASLGHMVDNLNNVMLGVRAIRVATTPQGWPSTAIGLGMDVDNTPRAGASLFLHANGGVGIGTTAAPVGRLHVQKDAGGALGASVALVNGGGGGNAAVSLDFYTYPPNGDPSGSIRALDDGNSSNHIVFYTKAPGPQTNNLVERLRITDTGKLSSPMLRVTHVMNQVQGPLPKSGGFSSGGGTLIIIFSGSGWGAAAGNIGLALQLDGGTIATTRSFTNETGSHKAFTTNAHVQGNIAAGNHTINLVALVNTNSDANDWYNVTVLELPI